LIAIGALSLTGRINPDNSQEGRPTLQQRPASPSRRSATDAKASRVAIKLVVADQQAARITPRSHKAAASMSTAPSTPRPQHDHPQ
jgi:hypothetical protein